MHTFMFCDGMVSAVVTLCRKRKALPTRTLFPSSEGETGAYFDHTFPGPRSVSGPIWTTEAAV